MGMPAPNASTRKIILALTLVLCAVPAAEAKHKVKHHPLPRPRVTLPGTLQRAFCGDGIVQLGEQCDNGSGNSIGGSCTPNCMLGRCGDGIRQPGESCDLGARNGMPGAECSTSCSLEFLSPGLPGIQPGNLPSSVPDLLGTAPKDILGTRPKNLLNN